MKRKINSAFNVLFRLLLTVAALAAGFVAIAFVGAWLFFSGDMRLNKISSPSYMKVAYGYLPYGSDSYYLIKQRTFKEFWKSPSIDDAFFVGHCNPLVRDEKRMTWLSENELQFYCHIRSCESIVKILPIKSDVKIIYIVEQDNREERNCLAEAL